MVVFPIHEDVITMTKIFKRISAVAMAAAMATTMAITASAESTVKSGTLKGHTTEAILSAYETYVDGVRMPWDFTAATVYGGDGTAYASLDVDDYYTGELLDRSERRGADTIGNVIGVRVGFNSTQSHVTLYSAHEVYSGADGAWGVYRQLINV